MSQALRQLIWLLTGAAALEILLPRGGMKQVCRLALGLALITAAASMLSGWHLPAPVRETAAIWRDGSPYRAEAYAEQVRRAWETQGESDNAD